MSTVKELETYRLLCADLAAIAALQAGLRRLETHTLQLLHEAGISDEAIGIEQGISSQAVGKKRRRRV